MDDDYRIPTEHMTDPSFGYIVGGIFILTKWVRENVKPAEPKFKVGDIVTLVISDCQIISIHRDCDGTPLYKLDCPDGLWSDHGMTKEGYEPIEED